MEQNIFHLKKLVALIVTVDLHRNGSTTYFHGCVIPAIVSPNMKQVISLEPEFIKKQDGYDKQDCENAAVKRWLNKNPQKQNDAPVTLLGDDLYSRQPICELALSKNYNFIFVCRETSHKTLYEWLEFLEKSGEVQTLEKKEWNGKNENNNILKNHGYNLEHNFGHGKNNLCEMLLSLNLLAFLFHSVLDLANSTYKKVRELLVSRRSFFNDIRTLLKYF